MHQDLGPLHELGIILSGLHRIKKGLTTGNGEPMANRMENRPELDKKWPGHGKILPKSISGPFWGPFLPLSNSGQFSIRVPLFPHFRLSGRFPFCTGPTGSQFMKVAESLHPRSSPLGGNPMTTKFVSTKLIGLFLFVFLMLSCNILHLLS